jgi:uncharacterized membrane protein
MTHWSISQRARQASLPDPKALLLLFLVLLILLLVLLLLVAVVVEDIVLLLPEAEAVLLQSMEEV